MSLFSCIFPAEFASLPFPAWKKSRYHFSEEASGPRQVRITSVGVQQIWKEWIPPVFMNMLCLIAISLETDECSGITYVWKKSHLTITSLITLKKRKLQLFAHCRYARLSVILCPAGGGVLAPKKLWHLVRCVWLCVYVRACMHVQPPNPTTGCRDNILRGQPRVLPTGWHFWQPLIEPRVLNYSYRCYGERLPFSQEKLTPTWIVAVYPCKWIQ